MKEIRLILKNGSELSISGISDDYIRIIKIQMKKNRIKKVWIKSEKEEISINKKDISLISYIRDQCDEVNDVSISSGLYS